MRIALLLFAAALAGCAAPPPPMPEARPASLAELRQTAPTASNYKVCRAVIIGSGDLLTAGREEQQRRSLDCSPYVQAVLANEAAQRPQPMDPLQTRLLNSAYPSSQPYQVPLPAQPTNCTSTRYGNQVQTTCQ